MTQHLPSPAPRDSSDHTTPPGPGAGGDWRDIRSSAAAAGGRCAIELELYRRTGALARQTGSPGARRFLAAASMAHAWRADLWERLLPVSIGLPAREELVVVEAGDAELLGSLDSSVNAGAGAGAGAGGTPAGVPAPLLEAVYPALLAGYEHLAETANRVSDGPLALTATRAADDVRRVLAEGLVLRLASVGGAKGAGDQPIDVREDVAEAVADRSLRERYPAQSSDPIA